MLKRFLRITSLLSISGVAVFLAITASVNAQNSPITPVTTENPKGNSFGMEGKISAPPPTQGGRITSPSGGQIYTSPFITVSGLCTAGLLVETLNNGVLVGSTMCQGGSFFVQIGLFPGQNELAVKVYDDLGQAGPSSNTVIVQYVAGDFAEFGQSITLTSNYSRRAADPGTELSWPVQLSGGSGPYAFSIDWGDGVDADLQSQAVAGIVLIKHAYKNAGIYRVTIRVTDANGASGFLQLIAVANGSSNAIVQTGEEIPEAATIIRREILWFPLSFALGMILVAFWLGGRYQTRALKRKLEQDAAMIRRLET
jgi:PKD domain